MANKFEDLTLAVLLGVAEQFAVDVKPNAKKAEVLAELEAMGVTYDQYEKALQIAAEHEAEAEVLIETLTEPEPEPVVVERIVYREPEEPTEIVLKMTRQNWIYETHGYRFSQDHPYVLCDAAKADSILRREDGFRPATPQEIREYYGLD